MPATRACPRCRTENDYARSNCQGCGGVMLGVGVELEAPGLQAGPALSRSNPAARSAKAKAPPPQGEAMAALEAARPDMAAALRERLAKAGNLSAVDQERIARLAQRLATPAAARGGDAGAPAPAGRRTWLVIVALVVLAGSGALFLEVFKTISTQEQAARAGAAAAAVQVAGATAGLAQDPSAVLADVQADQVAAAAAERALAEAQAAPLLRQDLRGSALVRLAPCLRRVSGRATKRPVFDLVVGEPGEPVEVVADDPSRLNAAALACLRDKAQALQLPPGLWHAAW